LYKLTGSLLALIFIVISLPVSATTGSRLKPQNEGDRAARHYDRAQQAAEQAAKLESSAIFASSAKAQEKLFSKSDSKYRKAAKLYKRALKVNPYMPGVKTPLAHALIKSKEFEQALSLLNEELERNPNDKKAIIYRTDALVQLGEMEKAEASFGDLAIQPRVEEVAELVSPQTRAWLTEQGTSSE